MALNEWAPLVIVGGFALSILVLWIGSKLEKPSRARRTTLWAGGLLMGATSLFWLLASAGVGGTLIILGALVVLPFVISLAGHVLGARRQRKAGPGVELEPIWPGFIALPWALGACFWWLLWSVNPALHLLDLSHEVDFHVTSGRAVNYNPDLVSDGDSMNTFAGTYELDGHTVVVAESWVLGREPTTGTTVRVGIGPVWPHQVIEDTKAAVVMLVFGTGFGLPATIFFTYLTLKWFGVVRKPENQVS